MAYKAKEIQKDLLMLRKGNRGEYIKISRIIPENEDRQQSVDVRVMYTVVDPNEGEQIRPTQKGVRMNSEMLPEIMAAIYVNMTDEEMADFESNVDRLKKAQAKKEEEGAGEGTAE